MNQEATRTHTESVEAPSIRATLARREIWILILVGTVLLLAALMYEGHAGRRFAEVVPRAVEDLGLAFIEAALLMAIIEMRAAREQIQQSLGLISRATSDSKLLIEASIRETRQAAAQSLRMTREAIDSVFRSVYQKDVPDELIEHYESTVFGRDFFRRDDEFIYTLHPPRGARPEEIMTVSVYHKYTMHNLTGDELDYDFVCETSLMSNQPSNELAQYFELRVDQQPVAVGPGQEIAYPGYRALMLGHRVKIPGGASRLFEVRWNSVRRVRDAELLITSWPSDGMTVNVNFDSSLDVSANELHPVALTEVVTGAYSRKWTLDAGMVPGQGVCLVWETKT